MQPVGKVYIREPWAREIVQRRKTIETAHISLPVRFTGYWLHVQNEKREIIGAVKFKGFKRYFDVKPFDDDFKKHRVMINSPYHYLNRRRCFGWLVADAVSFNEPMKAQPMKSQFRFETY